MGDISELRGLIVLMTVLCVTAFLINAMPTQFYVGSEPTSNPPTYFEAVDLQSFSSKLNFTLDKSDPLQYGWYMRTFTVGGWELRLIYRTEPTNPSLRGIQILHAEYWWIFLTGYHNLRMYDLDSGAFIGQTSPNHLTLDKMLQYYNSDAKLLKLKCQCDHVTISMYMAFNTTKYSGDITEAFLDGGLSVLVGVGFDQINTSMNVWSIFTSLFFFRIPMVHPLINALLTFSMWIAFAYIAGILVLRIIGAIFGGGA